MQCFAVRRDAVEARADVDFHHPAYASLIRQIEALPNTALLSEIIASPLATGFAAGKENRAQSGEESAPQIRPTQILLDGEIDLTDAYGIGVQNISERDYLQNGEVLFNNTNSTSLVGKSAVFRESVSAVCSNHVTRLRIRDYIEPEFAEMVLNMLQQKGYFARLCTNFNNQAGINTATLATVRIPFPPAPQREELVAHMLTARAERRAKLAEADALLAGMDDFVIETVGITRPSSPRSTFAIQTKDLTDAINPVRYQSRQIEKSLPFGSTVSVTGSLIESKFSPSKDTQEEQFDWIRIDDLPNRPWQVETVRTESGSDITGSLFEVQENDILIARLGPTILNAKFVLCPKLARRTVASGEFLVLRCNQNYQPEAVLWLLRTAIYREMMYLRSRGATPSRFRLSGKDLLSIPFPELDNAMQTAIVEEVRRRREAARRLRAEAEAGWAGAKGRFERELLGYN